MYFIQFKLFYLELNTIYLKNKMCLNKKGSDRNNIKLKLFI